MRGTSSHNAHDVMKSIHLSHHDVWRSLSPHDCENRILTAMSTHVVMPPRNRHAVHFTRLVCSPFYCKRISDAAVKWSVLAYTTCAVRCTLSMCYVHFRNLVLTNYSMIHDDTRLVENTCSATIPYLTLIFSCETNVGYASDKNYVAIEGDKWKYLFNS